MALPVCFAPTKDHNLDISNNQWRRNTIDAITSAVLMAGETGQRANQSFHPTLWVRVMETVNQLATLKNFDASALEQPELNEWLALLWGIFFSQIEAAFLVGDDDGANLIFADGSTKSIHRELYFSLTETRSHRLKDELIVLFFAKPKAGNLVWVGGYDPRCLVFLPNRERNAWDDLKGMTEFAALLKQTHEGLRLSLNFANLVQQQGGEVDAFLRFLTGLITTSTLGPEPNRVLRRVIDTLDMMRNKSNEGGRNSDFELVDSAFLKTRIAPILEKADLVRQLLKRMADNFETLDIPKRKEMQFQIGEQTLLIRDGVVFARFASILVYEESGEEGIGEWVYVKAQPKQRFRQLWIDFINYFVANKAFLFEKKGLANYLPLKPAVLRYFSANEIHHYFKFFRDENARDTMILRIDIPTRMTGKAYHGEVRFSLDPKNNERTLVPYATGETEFDEILWLSLWPNFKHPEWDNYMLSAAPGMRKDLYFVLHNQIAETEQDAYGRRYSLAEKKKIDFDEKRLVFFDDGFGDFIQLRTLDNQNQDSGYGGIFPNLPELTNTRPINDIAVDVGSSNTAIAARLDADEQPFLVDMNLHKNSIVLADFGITDAIKKNGIAILGLRDTEKDTYVFPTRALYLPGIGNKRELFKNFFPILSTGSINERGGITARNHDSWKFLLNIKWQMSSSTTDFRDYVAALLIIAHGQLSAERRALVRWENHVITYPLSIRAGLTYFTQYVVNQLVVRNSQPAMCSESMANYLLTANNQYLKHNICQQDGEYLLIMDMGGGTTDFSVASKWSVCSYDSLGPNNIASGYRNEAGFFKHSFGGNILEKMLMCFENTDKVSKSAKDFFQKVNGEVSKTKRNPSGNLFDAGPDMTKDLWSKAAMQDEWETLKLDDMVDLHVRVLVLFYLAFYYGSLQILGHATRSAQLTSEGIREIIIKKIALHMPGDGWKIAKFIGMNETWQVKLFDLVFQQVVENYLEKGSEKLSGAHQVQEPLGAGVKGQNITIPEVSAPFIFPEIKSGKAFVSMGATLPRNDLSEKDEPSKPSGQRNSPPTGAKGKGHPWHLQWDFNLTVEDLAEFDPDSIPNPFAWLLREDDAGKKQIGAVLDRLMPGRITHRQAFEETNHKDALKAAHMQGLDTLQQELAAMRNKDNRDDTRPVGTKTPFVIYLEGFYNSYFFRPGS